ncbi:phosphatase domain-containing protein [Bdellovibrio sp. HCB288]|uniref:phosphatase domain-containing protein n=1 Tax=Bdellovibrio sp. HCB288 TaxID=3394355 RepID=UPI0039B47DD8
MKSFWKQLVVIVVLVFAGKGASAQTIVITDIDDTVRPQYVQDLSDSAKYVFDKDSLFLGMSELLNVIAKDAQARVFYVTRAPEWLLGNTHRESLARGRFPGGVYFPRTVHSKDKHKYKVIEEIIDKTRPDDVIMLGDNGEADPGVYNTMTMMYPGIRFHQYIRNAYNTPKFGGEGTSLYLGQQFFVTPIEVALDLQRRGFLKNSSVRSLVDSLVPRIVAEKGKPKRGVMAFPYFVTCRDFYWSWDQEISVYPSLLDLKAKIEKRCNN